MSRCLRNHRAVPSTDGAASSLGAAEAGEGLSRDQGVLGLHGALSCTGQGSLTQEPLPTPCPHFGGLQAFPLPAPRSAGLAAGGGARRGHVPALRCWRWGQLAARAWPRAEPGCTQAKPACCGRRGEGIKSQPGPRGWCRPRDRQRARAGRELLALRQRGRGARRPGGGRELRAPRIVLPSAPAAGPRHGQVWPRTWARRAAISRGIRHPSRGRGQAAWLWLTSSAAGVQQQASSPLPRWGSPLPQGGRLRAPAPRSGCCPSHPLLVTSPRGSPGLSSPGTGAPQGCGAPQGWGPAVRPGWATGAGCQGVPRRRCVDALPRATRTRPREPGSTRSRLCVSKDTPGCLQPHQRHRHSTVVLPKDTPPPAPSRPPWGSPQPQWVGGRRPWGGGSFPHQRREGGDCSSLLTAVAHLSTRGTLSHAQRRD